MIHPLMELTPEEERAQLLGLACAHRYSLAVKLAILSFEHEPAPISHGNYQQLLHEIAANSFLTSEQCTHYQELVQSNVQVKQGENFPFNPRFEIWF